MGRWLAEATANAVLHGASATATTLPVGAALSVLTGYAAAALAARLSPRGGDRHQRRMTSRESGVPRRPKTTGPAPPGPPAGSPRRREQPPPGPDGSPRGQAPVLWRRMICSWVLPDRGRAGADSMVGDGDEGSDGSVG